jgi:hypothetical protein
MSRARLKNARLPVPLSTAFLWGNPAPKVHRYYIGVLNGKGVAFIPVYTITASISFNVVNGAGVRIYGCYVRIGITHRFDQYGIPPPFHHLDR